MSKPFGDPFELDAGVFTLDKAEGQRHKVARSYRLNAVQVPLLRGIGFLLLIVIGLLQALHLPEPMDVSRLAALVGFNLAYCVGSWLVLRRWFDRSGKLDLALLFLHTDIPVWFVTLYVIEGPGYQLLALFLLVRVADQAGFGFRRAFYFNNVIAAAYLGYVLILSFATAAGVNWPDRLLIFGALYLTGTYIAFTTIPIEYLTKRTRKAVHRARELLLELDEKSRQLEEASQHKSQFLASMSHELRTPLNAILGFNEMILDRVYGDVPAELNEPLEDIQKSGKHLLRLINNILDLAKIEAGRMELALADYSVHDIVESVRSTLRPLAAEKGLEFVTTLPDDLPLAYGDFGRITQCLMNLAGNSLKFTKGGKVEISVELQGATLVYRVSDTGMGIAPDKIGGLFTEFKQTDATIASEYGGTGLGLSISRKFIEMHGGRIWVESELGKGSHFIFQVPLRAEKAAA